MTTTPAAIFWDMDGTLVDTEPLWERFTYELSELMGRRLTPELRETTIGGSFRHTGTHRAQVHPGRQALPPPRYPRDLAGLSLEL